MHEAMCGVWVCTLTCIVWEVSEWSHNYVWDVSDVCGMWVMCVGCEDVYAIARVTEGVHYKE